MRTSLVLALALSLSAACGNDKTADKTGDKATAQTPSKSAVETETAASVSGVEAELPAIKAAIASAKPGDADAACAASMTNIAAFENIEKHKALAAELRQLCTVDLPAAKAKAGTP